MRDDKIIFFDGVCNLCNGAVYFITKRDKNSTFKFASLQGETASILIPKDFISNLDSLVLYDNGSILIKSSAALDIARELSLPWSLFSYFRLIPLFIRDWVYDIVSKNRYRLFGKKDTCRVPRASEKEFFLP